MPVAGDRVVFEGNKVGGGRREGQVLAVRGSFLEIRWPDGSSSLIAPGPGVVRVVVASRGGSRPGSASRDRSSGRKQTKASASRTTQAAKTTKKSSKAGATAKERGAGKR